MTLGLLWSVWSIWCVLGLCEEWCFYGLLLSSNVFLTPPLFSRWIAACSLQYCSFYCLWFNMSQATKSMHHLPLNMWSYAGFAICSLFQGAYRKALYDGWHLSKYCFCCRIFYPRALSITLLVDVLSALNLWWYGLAFSEVQDVFSCSWLYHQDRLTVQCLWQAWQIA